MIWINETSGFVSTLIYCLLWFNLILVKTILYFV